MWLMSKRQDSQTRPGVGRRPGADSPGRDELLDVAVALFAERGIANTTVSQIAAAGRVTTAMIHYWFNTREGLLDAVVDERVAPVIRYIWDPADPEPEEALALIRGIVERLFVLTEKTPWLPSLWVREIINEGGLLRERALSHIPQAPNAAFRQNIARAQARGEINSDIAPEMLLISMLGLTMLPQAAGRMPRHIKSEPATVDRERLQRHVKALVMHGVAGKLRAGLAGYVRDAETLPDRDAPQKPDLPKPHRKAAARS